MVKDVEAYIAGQKSPQKEICRRLRQIIFKTCPGIDEKMAMGVPWYEGRYYIVALKDHVNLGFELKRLSPQQAARLEGGGKTMKHVKFYTLEDIDEAGVARLLMMVKD
jgi:hypothetical protein